MTDVLYIAGTEQQGLAEPADFVDVVRDAYRQRGEGAPAEPRTKLLGDDPPGMFTTYVAMLPDTGYMGGYMYAAGFGGRNAWFLTPLFDAQTGELVAVVDGGAMNPYKTGAAGAVGVDALAKGDAETLGIIGAGTQARGQLLATATVRELQEIRIFSPTPDNRDALASEMDDTLDANVTPVDTRDDVLSTSDIVITATTASDPVFDGSQLRPGTHVTAMGQYDPTKRELDAETIERATYVPDLRDRAFTDAGSFLHALEAGVVDEDHIHGELGEVVAGNPPGRTTADEITVFDSGGTGIETVAAAAMLYERAKEQGRGTIIELTPASESSL